MKLKVIYPTNERKPVNDSFHRLVLKEIDVNPIRIIRSPCGTGAAANRYYYSCDYKSPDDASFSFRGTTRSNINRKKNPNFKPKELEWVDNVCTMMDKTE